jgi:hypothetical protein
MFTCKTSRKAAGILLANCHLELMLRDAAGIY